MKKQNQEEEYFLISGWQNREDNYLQSDLHAQKHQEKREDTWKKSLLPLAKLPFREHHRTKTKPSFEDSKDNIAKLKRDKELLERYFYRQSEFRFDSYRNSHQQQSLPLCRLYIQTQVMNSKPKLLGNYRSTEIQESLSPFANHSNKFLEKYTLFSGLKSTISKKRNVLLRMNSKENLQRPKLKTDVFTRNIQLMTSKCNFTKMGKMKETKQDKYQKKKSKFPLYFREQTSKQQKIRKQKHNSTFNLVELKKLKFSVEFQDDNLFSSKNI